MNFHAVLGDIPWTAAGLATSAAVVIISTAIYYFFFRRPAVNPQPSSASSGGDFGFKMDDWRIKADAIEKFKTNSNKPQQVVKPTKKEQAEEQRNAKNKSVSSSEDDSDSGSGSESNEESKPPSRTKKPAKKSDLNKLKPESLKEEFPCVYKAAEVRKAQKLLETQLTDEEKQKESEIKAKQLESIFNLMKEHEDKFGDATMNDVQDQLKLYAFAR